MAIKIERNKDGTVKGVVTMGDFIKEDELTPEQKKIREMKEKFEKKYAVNTTVESAVK